MKLQRFQRFARITKNTGLQTSIYITIIIVMANLNAVVDLILHPDIPYFDREHLIVGGVTGSLSTILFGTIFIYMRHLENALNTIKTLERILPICSNCKKIRKTGSDPRQMASWQPIESYITQRTTTKFSHGMCPDCVSKLYPGYETK